MKPSLKILIVRLSSLGDVLHTLPAFEGLRQSYPDAQIDWLAAPKSQPLLASVGGITTLYTIDTGSLLRIPPDVASWKRAIRLVRQLRFQNYDIVIDFQGLLKTAVLSVVSGSVRRLGFSGSLVRERPADLLYHATLEKPELAVHVTVLNQMLAGLAGAHPAASNRSFLLSDNDIAVVDTMLKHAGIEDFIVLNPGGGWPTKRWHPERFGALAERIWKQLGLAAVVTTGPGEETYFRLISENSGAAAVHHFPVSFLQLVPLLEKARLFVGGDTGPFHLACALKTPVVGIFGPTSTIRNGRWNSIGEVVARGLPCSPCHGRKCPSATECMDIHVDAVMNAVANVASINRKGTD